MPAEKRDNVLVEFFPKQDEFARAALSGDYLYLLYGGAIRGGKTVVGLALITLLCRMYPGSRWAIVRKDLPTIRRNTIPSFEAIRPTGFIGDIHRTEWTARCSNGSEILFFPESLKDDPDLNRFKGLEVNGFLLEEANELDEKTWNKTIERAGSWRCPGPRQPSPLVLLTCNPSRGYVKRTFYDPWKKGALKPPFFYLPAYVTDNPHLSPAYLASLENLRETDPRAYRRFVQGDWETADEPDQLIRSEWVDAAYEAEHVPGKKSLGVDVGRFGDDPSVIAHQDGNTLRSLEFLGPQATNRTGAVVQARMSDGPVDAEHVFVDVVGLGAGVVDYLGNQHLTVTEVVSGAKPVCGGEETHLRFKNLRSQLWWSYREGLRTGRLRLEDRDSRLYEDLTAPRYSISGDRVISVESKDAIKLRIGRSTDAGDAAVYADAGRILGAFDYGDFDLRLDD